MQLQYRGISYPYVPPQVVTPLEATTRAVAEEARTLMMNHHRSVKRREQSMLSRLDEKVGLPISTATQFWNHIQGKVHPSFWKTYDRSHVAMS
jgi:hypothetical protein